MKMKTLSFFLILMASAFFLSGCGLKKTTESDVIQAEPTPVPTRPIEQSIQDRPYVALVPTSDGHWVELTVKNIPAGVKGVEYDFIYFAENEEMKIERGVSTGGKEAVLTSPGEYYKKILFGSASCTTGVCKYRYDEGVTEGTLAFKLTGSEEYTTAYRLQKGSEAKEGLTTGDGIFSFVSSALFPKNFYLTTSTVGVPVALPSGIVAKSVPYGVFPVITAKGTVSFKTNLETASIFAYNGKSWQKLVTNIVNGTTSAESSGAYLFILTQ